jgi:hypothetical protein
MSQQTSLQAPSRSIGLPLNRGPAPFPGASREELLLLDYFQNAPTLKLAGVFKSEFWDSLVLQASETEPGVRHAIIALASAHRSRFTTWGDGNIFSLKYHDSFVLKQYNNAIKDLNSHMSVEDPQSVRITAISCMVFICLEMLRGEFHIMNTHFQHGINLLRHIQGRNGCHQQKHGITMVQDPQSLDEHLVHVFTRLHVQFLMLGYDPLHNDTSFAQDVRHIRPINIPKVFSTVHEVRQSLDSILNSVVHLVIRVEKEYMATSIHPPPPPTLLDQQRDLQVTISDWIAACEISTRSLLLRASLYELLGLRMLRIYGNIVTVMLSACFSVKETVFDACNSTFEPIIRQSEELFVLAANATPGTKIREEGSHQPVVCQTGSCFSIDMACYPPLYYTAIKCRIPHLRRRAVALLQQCQQIKGLWTGSLLGRIATRIIDMEEREFSAELYNSSVHFKDPRTAQVSKSTTRAFKKNLSSSTAESEACSSASLPMPFSLPEFSRIRCVRCIFTEKFFTFGFVRNNGPLGTLICHRFRHELGRTGGWEVRTCHI